MHAPANGGGIPRLSALPAPVRAIVEDAFGHGIGNVFAYAAPAAFLALIAILFIKEVPLRSTNAPVAEAGPGRHAGAVTLEQEPVSGSLIHGFVRDAGGFPVGRAAMTLIDVGGRQIGRTVTRDDGRYALSAPGRGTYILIASAGGRDPQAATVVIGDQATDFDLTLSGSYGLRGTVRANGRVPLADARVTLLDADGNVAGVALTGPDGEYAFANLTGGQYTVTASGYPPVASTVTVNGHDEDAHDLRLGHSAR